MAYEVTRGSTECEEKMEPENQMQPEMLLKSLKSRDGMPSPVCYMFYTHNCSHVNAHHICSTVKFVDDTTAVGLTKRVGANTGLLKEEQLAPNITKNVGIELFEITHFKRGNTKKIEEWLISGCLKDRKRRA